MYRKDNNQEFDHTYPIEHHTDFGDYVAVVYVDKRKGRQWILLYEGVPEVRILGFIRIKFNPVRQSVAGPTTNIHQAIKKMVTDYELPLYQQAKAEAIAKAEPFLSIDYEKEIQQRKARMQQLTEIEAEATTAYEAPTINDYLAGPELTDEQKRQQKIKEIADKHGMTEEQVGNLYQFQKKSS